MSLFGFSQVPTLGGFKYKELRDDPIESENKEEKSANKVMEQISYPYA